MGKTGPLVELINLTLSEANRMLRTTDSTGKMPDNTLSLESILRLRSEAHATIRHHAATIVNISSAITDIDAALMLSIAERSIDESQHLVDAARRLAALLDGSAVAG